MKPAYVYILASKKNGTLYIGVTSDLIKRIYEHKNGLVDGFTKKYKVHLLVYYEQFLDIYSAISREKQLKHWQSLKVKQNSIVNARDFSIVEAKKN